MLAAGYATRLYPLTLDRPKALLPVGGKPMLEHLLERLDGVPELDEIHVVTNSKFAQAFRDWAERYRAADVRILDDGTSDEETRLGAIGDLDLTIRSAGIDDDLLVLAGDNLFSEPLEPFAQFAGAKAAPAIGVYDVGDLEAIRKYNAIELDESDRITFFEEKPDRPTQHADRDRALLLSPVGPWSRRRLPGGGKQPRPAGTTRAVALSAHAGVRLACSGPLVRCRLEGDPRRGRPRFHPRRLTRIRHKRGHPRVTRYRLPSPEEMSVV